jgi:uncharacterized protein (DUF1697 family)
VRAEIDRRHGERCVIVVRPSSTLAALAAANPFAACAAGATDKLYVSFLSRQSAKRPRLPLVSPLERLTVFARHGREVLLVSGRKPNGFYGFPNALVEEAFGVPATTRNWSTVRRLAALLAG